MAEAPDDELERERAIVEETVAALRGEAPAGTDHAADRRRVRVVLEAIEAAR